MDATGTPPDMVGDLPSFILTFSPPTHAPAAEVTGLVVDAIKPNDVVVENAGTATELSTNRWLWVQTAPIDLPGTWTWSFTATGTLVDAGEITREIPRSRAS